MSYYLSNEQPGFAEWTSVVTANLSTITHGAGANFPERGTQGLRCNIVSTDIAYASKTTTTELAAGESAYIGFWIYIPDYPTLATRLSKIIAGSNDMLLLFLDTDGTTRLLLYNDAAGYSLSGVTSAILTDRWNYIVVRLLRASSDVASDGGGDIWINGVLESTKHDVDNYDRLSGALIFRLGVVATATHGFIADYDEVQIDTSYTEPYVPGPETDYLDDVARTLMLYRKASSDSTDFADYCVDEIGIPRCNLCPLPVADTETLSAANYTTTVEIPLASFLSYNPTVDGNIITFHVGYNVPGYFFQLPSYYSITSRLMRYGQVFSAMTANALYNPSTVSRLEIADLQAENMYCALRIDSDSLANAKKIVDDNIVASHVSIPDDDILYHWETAYRASLDCQHLRIQASVPTTLADDAITVLDADPTGFGSGGSRMSFLEIYADSANSLRTGSAGCYQAITNGYASIVGFTDPALEHDFTAFLEMLRLGGSLAEAMVVGSRYLDHTIVHVGVPGMKVGFSGTGYNVYRGTHRIEDVDYDTPVAYLRRSASGASLVDLGHSASTKYPYVVRPVWCGVETEDISCQVEFETDASSDWFGNRPSPVLAAKAIIKSGGVIRLHWHYRPAPGYGDPDDFAIWYGTSEDLGGGSPDQTVTYTNPMFYYHDFTLTDGTVYYFRLVTRKDSIESDPLTIGPAIADATAPSTPTLLVVRGL